MAFSLNFFQRVPSTTDFSKIINSFPGNTTGNVVNCWVFNATAVGANNSAAEVAASAYFDGAVGYLSQGDYIWAACNNGSVVLNVTSATGVTPVTTV